jgi:hypothetical protein
VQLLRHAAHPLLFPAENVYVSLLIAEGHAVRDLGGGGKRYPGGQIVGEAEDRLAKHLPRVGIRIYQSQQSLARGGFSDLADQVEEPPLVQEYHCSLGKAEDGPGCSVPLLSRQAAPRVPCACIKHMDPGEGAGQQEGTLMLGPARRQRGDRPRPPLHLLVPRAGAAHTPASSPGKTPQRGPYVVFASRPHSGEQRHRPLRSALFTTQ